jgi:hypothetical protein
MILKQSIVLVGAGVAGGVALTFASGRFISSQLFGVAAADPMTLALATGTVVAVGATAALLPAWRRAT